mmetsp:Transcript_16955/g.24142  ORF Transcript_16955/g.24142 Transcript_16955/m.24142 type:complete len:146 (+) Transcript_16955:363-800(+)
MYLSLALLFAKENMNKWNWEKCCAESVAQFNRIGIRYTTCARIVMKWYRQFKTKRTLPIVIPKKQLPPFLQQNPDICTTIKRYGKEHLAELSIEFIFNYVHDTILPKLLLLLLLCIDIQSSAELKYMIGGDMIIRGVDVSFFGLR